MGERRSYTRALGACPSWAQQRHPEAQQRHPERMGPVRLRLAGASQVAGANSPTPCFWFVGLSRPAGALCTAVTAASC